MLDGANRVDYHPADTRIIYIHTDPFFQGNLHTNSHASKRNVGVLRIWDLLHQHEVLFSMYLFLSHTSTIGQESGQINN